MQYKTENIRNICLLGHGGNGKTSFAEAMLYYTKGTDRLGKIADGTTVCDFDPEETKRGSGISAALAPIEWKGKKINIIDTPGYFDYEGEVLQGLKAADSAAIVVSAKNSLHVGTEKAYKYCQKNNMPNLFVVTKIDEENGDFMKVYTALRQQFGMRVCALTYPVIGNGKVMGMIDLLKMTYRTVEGTHANDNPIPPALEDTVKRLKDELNEALAETNEALMEKYFEEEPFTDEEVQTALSVGIRRRALLPVLSCSNVTLNGLESILNAMVEVLPSPVPAAAEGTGVYIFKTVADTFGKISYFKVLAGTLKSGMTLTDAKTGLGEKFGHIYVMKGKKQTEVEELAAGDIGAVTKLSAATESVLTSGVKLEVAPIEYPVPNLKMAITAKKKGDEEKIAQGLQKMMEEDKTFTFTLDSETKEQILCGMGEAQIEVLCSRLKARNGVEVELKAPRVAYRETIRKKVKVQGKHKKQSGGHGQYGDVWIEFEPCASEELIFEESIFGGAVPKNFFPAVEKGLREATAKGVLAGYPVVGVKATLVDGSYHDVDSSEMAFKTAAGIAFREGLPKAAPCILEPIGELKVVIPDAMMGDIIGDVNKRRGQIMGMNPAADQGWTEVTAEIPMSETATYAIDLRSSTRGRGVFTLSFLRYQEAPANIAEGVIAAAKAQEA